MKIHLIIFNLLLFASAVAQPKTHAEADSLVVAMRTQLQLNNVQYIQVKKTYRAVLTQLKAKDQDFSRLDFEFEVGKVLIGLLSAKQWQQWILPEQADHTERKNVSDKTGATSD